MPSAPSSEGTHEVHDRLDLVLDVRLAHGVNEEPGDDESLQADRHDDQQDARSPISGWTKQRQDPQQDPLERRPR